MNKHKHLFVVIATAVALCCPGSYAAQVRILFINGKNGKPLARTKVVIADVTSRAPSSVLVTDSSGFVEVDADSISQIRTNVESSFHQSCDSSHDVSRSYAVSTILSKGVTEQNTCGPILPPPTPDVLVRAFRRSPFIEALREN